MSIGLSVARIIAVLINLAPQAAQFANINSALILGDSDVIDVTSRLRSYSTIEGVATDFGTSAPEYKAAALFFSQAPTPTSLYIGKWARTAVAGRLLGSALSATQQLISNFTGLTSSGFKAQVDAAGAPVAVAVGTLAGVTTLNGVATAINTALTTASIGATCTWNSALSRFEIKSATTGSASKVMPLTAPASGTDLSLLLGLTAAASAVEVDGIAAETAVASVAILDGNPTYWYGLTIASASVVDADHLAVAAYIEATSAKPHYYGITTSNAVALDPTQTSDIGALIKAAGYKRTATQYSSTTPYAVASYLGRMLTTDYTANNTVITLMFKQEPGVTAESLTDTQAAALDTKRYNYFVNYNNSTAIIQNGWSGGPAYTDEIVGLDSFANNVQTDVYNALYQSPTKIPQTDPGENQLVNVVESTCARYVANGLFAPGTWTTGGFGSLVQGDFLPKGFYIYATPMALQASADRGARKATPIQIAAKLAGAIHSANIIVNVNR